MEFLCTQAGCERLQQAERRLSAGLYRQSSEEHSPNGLASDGSDGQGACLARHTFSPAVVHFKDTKPRWFLSLDNFKRSSYRFSAKINLQIVPFSKREGIHSANLIFEVVWWCFF